MAIELRGSAPLFEVFDMSASFAFYCGVLGFEVVNTNKEKETDPAHVDWAWLQPLLSMAGLIAPRRHGLAHTAGNILQCNRVLMEQHTCAASLVVS